MKNLVQKAKSISVKLPKIKISYKNSKSHDFGDVNVKKSGSGEDFWDFEKYNVGDSIKKIDWKRSSKQGELFIKNNESENANNIWFYVSKSGSMNYKNSKNVETKLERATLIGLIFLDVLLKSGEKVGVIGSELGLKKGHKNYITMASELIKKNKSQDNRIRKNDIVFFISDFLENTEKIKTKLFDLSQTKFNGFLIQILDSSEVNFPFEGRNRFFDPISGLHKLFNKSENMKITYKKRFKEHQEKLKVLCSKFGWKFVSNTTNESYESIIAKLYRIF